MDMLSSRKQRRFDAPTPALRPSAALSGPRPPAHPPGGWVLVGASGPNDYHEAMEQLAEILEAMGLSRRFRRLLVKRHRIAAEAVRRFVDGID